MSALNDKEREELVAFLDGELDEKRARAVSARISLDPRIRAEADALRQAWDMLEYLPQAEPSASFTHRTLERLAVTRRGQAGQVRSSPWRRRLVVLGWAAALLLSGGLTFSLVRWSSTPPTPSPPPAEIEEQLTRHLHVIQNQHLYELAGDLETLEALDRPDLFGDNQGS
jgi:anti-sigma factor RsiW